MQKPRKIEDFEGALMRMHELYGTRTQVELAEALGVRQSSISDAKRRRSIPDGWLVSALSLKNASPGWILYGEEPRWLVPADDCGELVSRAAIEAEVRAELERPLETAELIAELRCRVPGVRITIDGLGLKAFEDGLVAPGQHMVTGSALAATTAAARESRAPGGDHAGQ
ncbi:MAG: helix-turn-helix domain-containing protein [Desulfovibrio sp.]